MTTQPKPHSWTFFRIGGFDQVSLTTAEDLSSIRELDQKLWAALACPVKGLEFDERTLALIDLDQDGRVRAPEIIAAVEFADTYLTDIGAIRVGAHKLPMASIDASTPIGKAMVSCAKHILKTQGRPDDADITLADLEKARETFAKTPFNGDGVISASAAADDAATKQALLDIISTHGSIVDRDGQPGVDLKVVDAFFADAAAYEAWWKLSEAQPAETLPLGATTLDAVAAIDAIKTKVDDWFARCQLAAYDERAQQALNGTEKTYLAIASRDLVITTDEIRMFPLSLVKANASLPLEGALNPFWSGAVATLRSVAVKPLLGADKQSLSEAEWNALQARFARTRSWIAQKAGAKVEKLGRARVSALVASDARLKIEALIARDALFATEYDSITPVEKLVRLHRDLYRLLHNFINFADFYSHDRLSVFQAGTLYLDSRACELTVRVDNADKHGALAGLAKMYLAYCDCTRIGSAEKLTIAAAFTAGDSDNLLVGRNGIFYDRKGRDWDATIVKVVENPISIRQAFWAPYKRAIRFVEDLVAKRAASADQLADAKLTTGIAHTATAAETGKGPQKPKLDLSIITGIGVAIGGIATAIAGFAAAFFNLGPKMPLGFAAVVLGISLPSMIIAAMKLRQRNLGPILDANGWAVNGRVKINIPFGGSLTKLPRLPEGAKRSLVDPYAEKKRPWWLYITLGVLTIAGLWLLWFRLQNGRWVWQPAPKEDGKVNLTVPAQQVSITGAQVVPPPEPPAAVPTPAPK
jgi:hypothetical protein